MSASKKSVTEIRNEKLEQDQAVEVPDPTPELEPVGPQLKINRLVDAAKVPCRATPGSACLDLFTIEDIFLPPKQCQHVPLGISMEIPEGFVGLIFSRSGHGFKHQVRLSNCVGVIDSDYRGEVIIALKNDAATGTHLYVEKGQAIAQLFLTPVYDIPVMVVDELSVTERGEGGFGSTDGKAE